MLPHRLDEVERHACLAGIPYAMEHVGFSKYHVSCFYLRSDAFEEKLSSPFTHNHDLFLGMAMGRMGVRSQLQGYEPRGNRRELLRRTIELNVGFRSGRRALRLNAVSLHHAALQ